MRFSVLDRQSLWDDEMSTRLDMRLPLRQWPQRFKTYETHPPLYFLQLRLWQAVAGDSLTALRANSALWGTLSLGLLFLLMSSYGAPVAGLWAMALLSVSTYHLAYSQEMRPYSLAIALGLAGWIVLGEALRRRTGWIWLALGALWTVTLYTHYWESFVVLAQAAYGFSAARERGTRRNIITAGAVSAALFALWLPFLRGQLRVIGSLSFWVPPASPANLAKALVSFAGIYFHAASWRFARRVLCR